MLWTGRDSETESFALDWGGKSVSTMYMPVVQTGFNGVNPNNNKTHNA